MSTGDPDDILARLKGVMPPWFGGDTPIIDALLYKCAQALSFGYDFLIFAKKQARIATAESGFIDLIGWDFFASRFHRRKSEDDDSWRSRILPEILRERGTRKGIVQAVEDLTGREPVMFEFTNPYDAGSYGGPYIGYGLAGGWGSVLARTQALLTAYRPATTGIPEIPGWSSTVTIIGHSLAGYGYSGKWASLSEIEGEITDAMIYQTVAETQASGVTVWTRIVNGPIDPGRGLNFSDDDNSEYLPFF